MAAEAGYILRPTGCGAEIAVYRPGTRNPLLHAATYFAADYADAADTARAMACASDATESLALQAFEREQEEESAFENARND